MRSSITKNGLTLRVIAGTHNAILGLDLQDSKRKGCLGFSIQRTDLGPAAGEAAVPTKPPRWLPNMLQFATAPKLAPGKYATTETAPLQKFRWGDYALYPGQRYRFRVVPRYGTPDHLLWNPQGKPLSEADGVTVDITTEDPMHPETMVLFNRAAAASEAFNQKFKGVKNLSDDSPDAERARTWLSNGLEEGLLAYLAQATGPDYALHAAVYEFQKPALLAALKAAAQRGAAVDVVYHARQKGTDEAATDATKRKNEQAIADAGLPGTANLTLRPRKANPQAAIMHNKFVVLLKRDAAGQWQPQAVWTGSTNWTDGGLYGQLNVGHAVYEPKVAATYEQYFQLLATDPTPHDIKHALAGLTPVSLLLPSGEQITPVFSPQSSDAMLHLYASVCQKAQCLFVSAPFALSPIVLAALTNRQPGTAQFMLLDKQGSLGKGEQVQLIQNDPATSIAVATTLSSPLHDFQNQLLAEREGFHHAGIHIHSKIILADPFGSEPVLVTGSANFSNNSTEVNDSNSLVVRGHTAVADIYATDFMRMFEHYHFRASVAKTPITTPLGLRPDDTWADKYYVKGSKEAHDRRLFAGTL
jgi:phosphatidylserine/phosphatidylglycerophosphate/cardiolipin synthase-like enzyme